MHAEIARNQLMPAGMHPRPLCAFCGETDAESTCANCGEHCCFTCYHMHACPDQPHQHRRDGDNT